MTTSTPRITPRDRVANATAPDGIRAARIMITSADRRSGSPPPRQQQERPGDPRQGDQPGGPGVLGAQPPQHERNHTEDPGDNAPPQDMFDPRPRTGGIRTRYAVKGRHGASVTPDVCDLTSDADGVPLVNPVAASYPSAVPMTGHAQQPTLAVHAP